MLSDRRILNARGLKFRFTDIFKCSKTQTSLHYSCSHRLFFQLPSSPTTVSWTAASSSTVSLHNLLFMLRHQTLPTPRILASIFKTAAALSARSFGLSLHGLSIKLSLAENPFPGSALISFYCKLRLPEYARKVFDEMPERDGVCYASLIVGLARNARGMDALEVFGEMRRCGVGPCAYSVSGAMRAAAEMAVLEQCRVIHGHVLVTGLERDVIVGSGLIDGYGKAGLSMDARRVFDELLSGLNVVGWNAMMAGYAQHGDKDSVLELFDKMDARGLLPDEYSFLAILTVFCNAGMCDEGGRWIERMSAEYGVEPGLEHYTCLVSAMGRAGRLEEAEQVAMTMPFEPDAAVWRALLSSCAYHGAADMAWTMARRLLELDPLDDSAYAIVANVFSAKRRWDDVAHVRKLMKVRRVKKEEGKSWVEVKGQVHVFLAGDTRHDRTDEIYFKLAELMEEIKKLGYVPVWDEMLHEVGEEEKREALQHHSEKLALAFCLVSGAGPPGKALRIVKNLRICKDCHVAFKYMSRALQRDIIVRDVNRYHRFFNGTCNCGDIW